MGRETRRVEVLSRGWGARESRQPTEGTDFEELGNKMKEMRGTAAPRGSEAERGGFPLGGEKPEPPLQMGRRSQGKAGAESRATGSDAGARRGRPFTEIDNFFIKEETIVLKY